MSKRAYSPIPILSIILFVFVNLYAQPELDISFNSTGRVISGFGSGSAEAKEVLIQPDGRIVAVGTWRDGAGLTYFALTRFNSNGSIDKDFGDDGRVVTDLDPSFANEGANAAVLQPDGKIIAAGFVSLASPGQGYFALARYNSDGSLDATFGSGGKVLTSITQFVHEARDVALGPDGTIVAAGSYHNGTSLQTLIAKYSASGDLLWTKTDTRGNFIGAANVAESAAILADGRILTCGNASGGLDNGITFAGYTPGGAYDTTFGIGGRHIFTFPASMRLRALTIAPDGRYYAAGSQGADFLVARFFGPVSWDISFNGSGSAVTPMGGNSLANSIVTGPNGKIVAAGTSSAAADSFAVAVYTSNGSTDSTFSGDGRLTFGFDGSAVARANSAKIDGLGRIVLGGTSAGQFAIARLYTLDPVPVTVAGRAVTPEGTPIRNARIGLADSHGVTSWSITNAFGFFQFDNIATGQTCNVFVRGSKTHLFEAKDIGVNSALNDIELVGAPRAGSLSKPMAGR